MNCDEVRPRLTAHLLGEDAGVADHVEGCASCGAELRSLRETVELLRAYDRPARRRSWAPYAAAAAVLLGLTYFFARPGLSMGGPESYLVSEGGSWRFARGERSVDRELRVGTLPGRPVRVGGIEILGGSVASVGPDGVRLEEGEARVVGACVDARGTRIDARSGEAVILLRGGEARVSVVRGSVDIALQRVTGPSDISLEALGGDMPAPPMPGPVTGFDAESGASAVDEFRRHLTGSDEGCKISALHMAVLLRLTELTPSIQKIAGNDRSASVRRAAVYAAWRLDADASFFRGVAIHDADPEVRSSATLYLGTRGAAGDVEDLVRAIDDTGPAAILALSYLAAHDVELPVELDGRLRLRLEERGAPSAVRYACARYLDARGRISTELATSMLFNPHEQSEIRRLAAGVLRADDADAALETFRQLFDSEGGRLIAIDLLGHYGTNEDLKRLAALLDDAAEPEQARVFRVLGIRANAELSPPVPLSPTPGQRDEVRRRLQTWVHR